MVAELVFYMFATVAVLAALGVVNARNPVHSVLFLVLAFFSTAGVFVLLQAEFLAALLVIVYMGAVAILFLFVVMLLDVDFAELKAGMAKHLPMGLAVGGMILVELVVIAGAYHVDTPQLAADAPHNTLAIGRILYSQFLFPFEVASLILLVAMIGAIVLTHRARKGVRKQVIAEQLARTKATGLELKKVASGEGAPR